jgi:hypothetical protein
MRCFPPAAPQPADRPWRLGSVSSMARARVSESRKKKVKAIFYGPKTKKGTVGAGTAKNGERDFDCAFKWRNSLSPIKAAHTSRASFPGPLRPMELIYEIVPRKSHAIEKIFGFCLACQSRPSYAPFSKRRRFNDVGGKKVSEVPHSGADRNGKSTASRTSGYELPRPGADARPTRGRDNRRIVGDARSVGQERQVTIEMGPLPADLRGRAPGSGW